MNPDQSSTPQPRDESGAASAPDAGNVHEVRLADKRIVMVGTAHISQRSVEEVRDIIAKESPDTVCVELDEARHRALTEAEAFREMDVVQIVRRGQAAMLLAHLVLSAFQRRLGRQLGIKPGAEMVQAIESCGEAGAELVLADRDVRVTLRRTWASLGWLDKIKLASQLMLTLVMTPTISAEEIEQLKQQDMLGQVMDTFARAFPKAKTVLIDERDTYLAEKVRSAPGSTIVAVVGAGHMEGILKSLGSAAQGPAALAELERVPPRSKVWRGFQWGIPLLVLGLIAYGFIRVDAEAGMEMVTVWVLANGLLAALGTLVALAHPVTIAAAFLAAPLTSLNPMVAAGWVAGLVEAVLRRPKVRDFERLSEDVVSLKGFWKNGITRILLVVALANVGSSVGTLIGLPLMTRLLG